LKENIGVAVPLRNAEETLQTLRKLQLVDDELEPKPNNHELLIPLRRNLSDADNAIVRKHCPDAKLQAGFFSERKRARPRDLLESLHGTIPQNLLRRLPRAYDIVGDIAIIDIPEDLSEFATAIGRGLLEVNPNARLVLRISGDVTGPFRTRKFQIIAGSGSTETLHRECSCVFHLDVASVYFNPRLSHERMRIAGQVGMHETVIDMFAGVGPYSILIARTQVTSRVTAIDANPEAFRYLRENTFANGVADRVTPVLADARTAVSRSLKGSATRVIMNLPSEAIKFIDAAAQAVRPDGGIIHFYTFASRSVALGTIKESVASDLEQCGRRVVSIPFCRPIREIAPNRVHVAIDIEVE